MPLSSAHDLAGGVSYGNDSSQWANVKPDPGAPPFLAEQKKKAAPRQGAAFFHRRYSPRLSIFSQVKAVEHSRGGLSSATPHKENVKTNAEMGKKRQPPYSKCSIFSRSWTK